ncbi:DUF5997 family protein [Nocardia sp. NBC_00508]|uniref:DUF5997 family protein n=1 Tax=Nocardia sp. NBC_00508 TaxID=2975992 RepID=UPI002E819F47|nr:DUF5997 family protein [Nocardia sp. NBC_00508]WUD65015.1 DUF5997 family protein [Nocardia sp. NBC_00508]
MKPLTAANKLGIYLPAAPEEFRNAPISRAQLDALRNDPPEWLTELRRAGPFPRDVLARKLGVSNAGLARAQVAETLTAEEIGALLADPPEWLLRERASYAAVRAENARIKAKEAERRAATNRPARNRG